MTPTRARSGLARAALPAVCAALASCAASNATGDDPLPFHVALLPIRVHDVASDPGSGDAAVALRLEAEEVRARLVEVLARRSFARVSATVSDPLSGDESLEAHLADAREKGADLVLACTVEHDVLLHARRNEKFWLNLPLFLLGGPFCYFIDDHSYPGRVRLGASVQDLQLLVEGRATLSDGRSEYAYLETRLENLTLDFLRRSPGVWTYAASLLVPSGLLAKDNQTVRVSLARLAAEELARGLADELSNSDGALRDAGRVHDFFLDDDAEARDDETGTLVRGRVLARAGSPVRLAYCEARLGEGVARAELAPPAVQDPRARYVEHAFELRLEGHGEYVRLEIHALGRDPAIRRYTLPVQ